MKKITLSIGLLMAFAFGNAQEKESFSKGNRIVSGSISFMKDSEGESESTEFQVSPRAGIFITNNLLVGAAVGIGSQISKVGTEKTEDVTKYNVGAFARYYSSPLKKFSVFGHAGIGFENEKDLLAKVSTNSIDIRFSPGISYFLSDKFIIDAMVGSIGYNSSKTDEPDSERSKNFNIDLDITQIQFGLMYKF